MGEGLGTLERGMVAGREYASRVGGDHAKLRPVVKARNAEETRAAIDWNLIEAIEGEQPVAFWSGFAHGVRQFLVDEAAKLSAHRPGSSSNDDRPGRRSGR